MRKPDVLLCRKASDPLRPDSALGYRCKECGEPLQVSAAGRNQLAASGQSVVLLCNPCGVALAKRLGDDNVAVGFNPNAVKQLQQWGITVEDVLGDAKKGDA